MFDKPFALSMGPQRAGTTWLDRYLRSRGDICLPFDVKEIFYFDRHYDRGAEFYKSHFKPGNKDALVMEITATSFDCVDAPRRVLDNFGKEIRMLCPLRHPVTRSYSLYLHYSRYGIVSGSLQEAVAAMPQIIESSFYHEHLQRWLDMFGDNSLQILYQEDLETNQKGYIQKVCEGLSLPYKEPAEDIRGKYNTTSFSKFGPLARFAQNTADWLRAHRMYGVINCAKALGLKKVIFGKERPDAGPATMSEHDKAFLQDHLGQEVEKLEALLGHSIPQWRE